MRKYKIVIIIVIFFIIIFISILYKSNKMYVKLSDNIQIEFYSIKDSIGIVFDRCGVNNIYGIKSINYYNNIVFHNFGVKSSEFTTCSDWIGPYMVAIDNSNNEDESKFTGGWHGSNGDGTGSPTATCNDIQVLIDGIEVEESFEGYCNTIQIKVSNNIQTYQSPNQYVIEENIIYEIDNTHNITVTANIKALEDISIERYYGLQVIIPSSFDKVSYIDKNGQIESFTLNRSSNSINNSRIIDTILIEDDESNHFIIAKLNTGYGLGKYNYKDEDKPYAFTTEYGKAYFNLVNGKEIKINQFDEISWQGNYIFY